MKRSTWWQFLTLISILLLVVFPLIQPFSNALVQVGADEDLVAQEYRMLDLVNAARSQAGLAPLGCDARLVQMARDYSWEMITYNFFSHNSPVSGGLQQRIAAHGISGWLLAGENIAKAPNVDIAFNALMSSPSHRANILRREFNSVGIGILRGPEGLVITQEFMQFAQVAPPPPRPATPVFDTYILIMNPNDSPAGVSVVFQKEDGSQHNYYYNVGAHSRMTISARSVLGQGSFSTRIQSNLPVLAERAMYFDLGGRSGGHDSIGTNAPAARWYFAEGYTGGSFDTYICLQNPNQSDATATLRFMRDDGTVIPLQVSIPAQSRYTVHVDELEGLQNANFSTEVVCDLPLVAERAMYFNCGGKVGGSVSIGSEQPSATWYLAEGCVY